MRIGVIAFGNSPAGDNAIGREVVARLNRCGLPDSTEILDGGAPVLKTLQSLGGFDGLVIVDAATMGEPPGTVKTYSLNEIVLAGEGGSITLHNVGIESELIFASKFLSLPPTTIIAIEIHSREGKEASQKLLSNVEQYVSATTRAIARLRGQG